MALKFTVRDFGQTFATRERGAELREELRRRADEGDEVIVDFADVTNVSYSFADEFLGKLCADPTLSVSPQNLAPSVARVAHRAIERRTDGAMAC
ncbi:MAG TPA: STAS-like domain-containing protein [Conexibacter sp.]|nr:STAS-like domain-containing protein [Conexibacter sp.]